MEKFEIRVLLKFFWKKGLSSRAAVKEISQVEGRALSPNLRQQDGLKNLTKVT